MNPLPSSRSRSATGLLAIAAIALTGCRHQQPYVQPDSSRAPAPASQGEAELSSAAPIVAPAPFWPPGPPAGTPVYEIGSWDRLGVLIGYQQFDSSWDPFEDQTGVRLTGTHEWRDAPIGVEWSVGYSSTSEDELDLRFTNQNFELSVGPTRTFHLGGAKWFLNLGLGLSWIYTEEGENTGLVGVQGETDGWFAGYGHASLIFRVFPAWDLAIDVRGAKGEDVELGPLSLDGQYWQIAFGFGVGI